MIRVIIERKIDESCLDEYLEMARNARKQANMVSGFIAGELLQEKNNPHHAIIISSWEDNQSWIDWSVSEQRQKVLSDMRPLLQTDEKVTILENSHF